MPQVIAFLSMRVVEVSQSVELGVSVGNICKVDSTFYIVVINCPFYTCAIVLVAGCGTTTNINRP